MITLHETKTDERIELRDYEGGPLLYTIRFNADNAREYQQDWTLEATEHACPDTEDPVFDDEAGPWHMDCHTVDGARFYALYHRTENLKNTPQPTAPATPAGGG